MWWSGVDTIKMTELIRINFFCIICGSDISHTHSRWMCSPECRRTYRRIVENAQYPFREKKFTISTSFLGTAFNIGEIEDINEAVLLRKMVREEKDRVIQDCINNPRKYLED